MRRVRVVAAVLLAAVLASPAAGAVPGKPPADKVGWLTGQIAGHTESLLEGMSCTAAPIHVGDGLLVVGIVCQQKEATGG